MHLYIRYCLSIYLFSNLGSPLKNCESKNIFGGIDTNDGQAVAHGVYKMELIFHFTIIAKTLT